MITLTITIADAEMLIMILKSWWSMLGSLHFPEFRNRLDLIIRNLEDQVINGR